jgi:hypothetical protein
MLRVLYLLAVSPTVVGKLQIIVLVLAAALIFDVIYEIWKMKDKDRR